jgi:2-phosphosulfolactate phosphatase
MTPVRTYFLPSSIRPGDLQGATAIVVDVLRASTTLIQAFQSGLRRAYVEGEVGAAIERTAALRRTLGKEAVLLGGERKGIRLPGFDLGNSPAEYDPETVDGKTLVFTTTNGTRALLASQEASRIVFGAFTNLAAIRMLLMQRGPIAIVCAGTDGEVTWEDVLFAGALADRLLGGAVDLPSSFDELPPGYDDATRIAIGAWREFATPTGLRVPLASLFAESLGGRNLIELGMESDLFLAAQIDKSAFVPTWNPDERAIEAVALV